MSIINLTACELSRAIHTKQVSCLEVMQAYLAQVAKLNPTYNAIINLRPEAALLAEAQAKDALLAQGQSQGWLHGIPQAPKDLTATAGLTTTLGYAGFKAQVPPFDSLMAARLRASGAIFIGKTNTPEFGLGSHTYNTLFGATRNAINPAKSAGGSSGGTAVALATRMLPVADGSDMMGSLRNPAAWNGIYGLRPSLGRVPYGSIQSDTAIAGDVFFQQLGTEGPMARNIADLAQMLQVQSGFDARAPLSFETKPNEFTAPFKPSAKGLRIGWLGDLGGYLATEPAVLASCEAALSRLAAAGASVEPVSLKLDLSAVWQSWLTLRGLTVAGNLAPLYANPATKALLKPEAVWEFEQGSRYSAMDIARAASVRSQLYAAFAALHAQFDVIALPAAQCVPFAVELDWPKSIAGRAMDTYHRWMECTIYATLASLPALAAPAGLAAESGLAVGLQFIGKPRGERALLEFGAAWEAFV